MRYILTLSLITLLSGCLGTNKPQPESTSYDFGLGKEIGTISSNVSLSQVTAIDAIDHRRIRYRLNYQNPTQVFTYSQHRWTTSPADLTASKFRTMVKVASWTQCSMKIEIETFDHVFESANSSTGIVKLHATIHTKKSRDVLASNLVQEVAPAPSADAKGGVAALDQASSAAISKLVEWANSVSAEANACAKE